MVHTFASSLIAVVSHSVRSARPNFGRICNDSEWKVYSSHCKRKQQSKCMISITGQHSNRVKPKKMKPNINNGLYQPNINWFTVPSWQPSIFSFRSGINWESTMTTNTCNLDTIIPHHHIADLCSTMPFF